jgi:hypothetical protein
MRIETITRTLYTFDELSDSAKQKAIEKLSDINIDFEWWSSVYEDAQQVGIKITSFDLDRSRHACANIDNCLETAELILNTHGDCCETYKTAKTFLDKIQPLIDKLEKAEDIAERWSNHYTQLAYNIHDTVKTLIDEIEELKDNFKKSIIEDFSIMLQNEYEYLTSEDAIVETIKSNEYEFIEDGELA